MIDPVEMGVMLLCTTEPTDRALRGWNPVDRWLFYGEFDGAAREWRSCGEVFLETVRTGGHA